MGDFKFWPVALAGAELIRRRPAWTFGLMLVGLVVSVGFGLCLVISLNFQVYHSSRGPFYSVTWLTMLASGLLVLVTAAIIGAPVMRTLATDDHRARRTRFGGDEARLIVLSLLLAPAALIVFAAIILGAAICVTFHMSEVLQNRVITAAVAVGLIVVLVLASRLSLAGPIAVRDGRLRLLESWRLTRPRRWKVFGVFLVATGLAAATAALGTFGVDKAQSALKLSASHNLNPSLLKSILDIFKPESLPSLFLSGVLIGLALILYAAPAAALHRALVGDRGRDQAAVFD